MGKWTYPLSAVFFLATATSTTWAAEKSFDKHFDVPAGGHLIVDTPTGSVTVSGRDSSQIVIHADIEGTDDFVDNFSITAEQQSSEVTVRGHQSELRSWFDWLGVYKRVKFVILVPRNFQVDVQTSGGGIDVSNLNGAVTGSTSGGGIEARDVTGTIDMRTSGGGIYGARLNGPTELRTSGGSIHVEDSKGNLDARTSGGGIRLLGIDGRVVAKTSGGGIYVEAHSNRGATLSTSGGGVVLLLPADTHASLDAATSGGTVRVDFPVTISGDLSRSHVHGTINGGGEPIFLHTSGGGIHLGPL